METYACTGMYDICIYIYIYMFLGWDLDLFLAGPQLPDRKEGLAGMLVKRFMLEVNWGFAKINDGGFGEGDVLPNARARKLSSLAGAILLCKSFRAASTLHVSSWQNLWMSTRLFLTSDIS